MEASGKNPEKLIVAIIPARYESTRLEGKLLLPLNGKPLILHTLMQANKVSCISRVIVATDDERILRVVEESGGKAILTSASHKSGSDRIAQVAKALPAESIVVNVQGDEPLISPKTIEKAVRALMDDDEIQMSTTSEKINDVKDVTDPNVVKVVSDEKGLALYFSRSPIPFPREAVSRFGSIDESLKADKNLIKGFRKHTGLYVYRREFLLRYTQAERTDLEDSEMLEQLRALEMGAKIKVIEVDETSIGVDTKEDFERVRSILEN